MNTVIPAVLGTAALVMAIVLSVLMLRKDKKAKTKKHKEKHTKMTKARLRSITRFMFVTTQVSALVWVFTSYGIAIYSAVELGQVYTMSELSEPAIRILIGECFLKVLENIFEHNNSKVFGRSTGGEDNGQD